MINFSNKYISVSVHKYSMRILFYATYDKVIYVKMKLTVKQFEQIVHECAEKMKLTVKQEGEYARERLHDVTKESLNYESDSNIHRVIKNDMKLYFE